MNRYFEDTRYYLARAVTTAKKGVTTEVEPVVYRVRARIGREADPEPSRLDAAKADLSAIRDRAEGEAKGAIADARGRIEAYRKTEA